MPGRVPVLSLADYAHGGASAREAFSKALMSGLQRYGFIILRDHAVDSSLIDEAYALSAKLFATPEAVKRRFVAGPRGYAPFRTEHAKNHGVPDLKEFWQIGPEFMGNRADEPLPAPPTSGQRPPQDSRRPSWHCSMRSRIPAVPFSKR